MPNHNNIYLLVIVTGVILIILVFSNFVVFGQVFDTVKKQRMLKEKMIEVGKQPGEMVIDQTSNKLYVLNSDSDSISVIYNNLGSSSKEIRVGTHPIDAKLFTEENKLYVANSGSNTVSVIDGDTDNKVADIPVGIHPTKLEPVTTDKLYVANSGSNTVAVINITSNKKIKDITVGYNPSDMALDGNKIYVANFGSNTVSVIDGDTDNKVADIPVGNLPKKITVTPSPIGYPTHDLYVVNSGSHNVYAIRLGKMLTMVKRK